MSKFKPVTLHAPFISIQIGTRVVGTIERHTAAANKFNKGEPKPVVILRLTEAFNQKVLGKDGKPRAGKDGKPLVEAYKVGDAVQLDVKAGLLAICDLEPGTEVEVVVTGQIDTGKGNPAWTFDLGVA